MQRSPTHYTKALHLALDCSPDLLWLLRTSMHGVSRREEIIPLPKLASEYYTSSSPEPNDLPRRCGAWLGEKSNPFSPFKNKTI